MVGAESAGVWVMGLRNSERREKVELCCSGMVSRRIGGCGAICCVGMPGTFFTASRTGKLQFPPNRADRVRGRSDHRLLDFLAPNGTNRGRFHQDLKP